MLIEKLFMVLKKKIMFVCTHMFFRVLKPEGLSSYSPTSGTGMYGYNTESFKFLRKFVIKIKE